MKKVFRAVVVVLFLVIYNDLLQDSLKTPA